MSIHSRAVARRTRDAARAIRSTPDLSGLRMRLAEVVSLDTDATMTVLLGGTVIPGVYRSAGSWLPPPGGGVWLVGARPDLWALTSTDPTAGFSPRADRATTQALANNTPVAVSFTAINPDPDPFDCWDVGNPTEIIVPVSGRYRATGWVKFDNASAGGTGWRAAYITTGGTLRVRQSAPAPGTTTTADVTVTMPARTITKGVAVTLVARHTAGVSIDLQEAHLSVEYLGPG